MMLVQYPRGLRDRYAQIVEAQVARGAERPRSIVQRVMHGATILLPVMQSSDEAAQRKSLIGSGDRSERIRTYNFPQNRVTDHRINLNLYRLDAIVAGDLAELFQALKEFDKKQRLGRAD